MTQKLIKSLKWALILAVTVLLFLASRNYALLERGYHARGGELAVLLIPVTYLLAGRAIKDALIDIRDTVRELIRGVEHRA